VGFGGFDLSKTSAMAVPLWSAEDFDYIIGAFCQSTSIPPHTSFPQATLMRSARATARNKMTKSQK
jgi:hypothetical protein